MTINKKASNLSNSKNLEKKYKNTFSYTIIKYEAYTGYFITRPRNLKVVQGAHRRRGKSEEKYQKQQRSNGTQNISLKGSTIERIRLGWIVGLRPIVRI